MTQLRRELKLFRGRFNPSRRRIEPASVQGWTLSGKDGLEAEDRRSEAGRQLPSPANRFKGLVLFIFLYIIRK
jgi:hypothetical protein